MHSTFRSNHALALLLLTAPALFAQATPNTTQRGTVKAVSATSVTITTDSKADLTVSPADGARILQLAPGSTDLKTASPITLSDIAPGDRVLVTGHPGEAPATVAAARIILMKSTDIASLRASQSARWQSGTGGIVRAVAPLTVAVGPRTLTVTTAPTTIFRRYAGDSVKFEDARLGTLSDIHPGDQLRVRGARSDDGTSLAADEIVSGSFENLAGAISAVDPAKGTVTLRDLTTKKVVTVSVTPNSDLRHLSPEAGAAFARSHTAGGPGGRPGGDRPTAPGDRPTATGDRPSATSADRATSGRPAPGDRVFTGDRSPTGGRAPGAAGATPGETPGNPRTRPTGAPDRTAEASDSAGPSRPRGGNDLSQIVARMPAQTLAELHPGDAVLIVASIGGSGNVTAITLLSGVEQILSATPTGETAPTLSPWNLAIPGGGQ